METRQQQLKILFIGNKTYEQFESATINQCYTYLKDKDVISLDIETTKKYGGKFKGEGLDPYLSKIIMLQIGDENQQFVIDCRNDLDISPILALLTDKTKTIVGQNIKFEYKHMLHTYKVRLERLYDTMIVEQILFNGLNVKASLKALNEKYLNITVDKSIRDGFAFIGDRDFTVEEIKYGAEDILYPLLIRNYQLKQIEQKQLSNCVNLEMLFIPVLGDIEYKGMHFNKAQWKKTYEENLEIYKKLKQKLNNYVIDNYFETKFIVKQYDMFDDSTKCNISWGSPKQTIDFFKFLGVCPQEISKTTKKLTYTVNANVLKTSLNTINKDVDDELKAFIKLYLLYKKTEQACTTFGIDYFKYINPITHRLHSNYRQILNTGRISSSNPNLQNIPSKESFRSAFNAPENFKIVNADYSGQEQIILANKSGDKDLLFFYNNGFTDMHSFIASKIYNKPFENYIQAVKDNKKDGVELSIEQKQLIKERQIAKSAGFAINYGGNGHTISKNLGISAEQGDKVYDAYFKSFPGLKDYFRRVQEETLLNGYILIDPITNRKNWFKPPRTSKEKGKVERNALNYPIQGEAGGITKLAPILFRKWILEQGLEEDVFITNIVHDEINVESHNDKTEVTARNLEKYMQAAGDRWCKTIPLKADAVITDFWNH